MQGSSCATDGGLTPTLNNLTSLPESEEGNSWLTPRTLSLYTVDIGLHNCGGPQLRRFLWYDLYPSWESVKPCGEMSVNPLEAVLLSLISLGGVPGVSQTLPGVRFEDDRACASNPWLELYLQGWWECWLTSRQQSDNVNEYGKIVLFALAALSLFYRNGKYCTDHQACYT